MAEDLLKILYSVNKEVDWDLHLDTIEKGVENYQKELKNNRSEPEQYLNAILPTYWDVFHTHNTYRRKHGELEKRGEDETLLPSYNIGIFLVGYSSLPIALSLAEIQPSEQIYFLYSKDTQEHLDDIYNRLSAMLNDSNQALLDLVADTVQHNTEASSLEIDDPSDPVSTFKRIKEIIDKIENAENKRIALDLTGGKKTMLGGGYTAGAIWTSRWSAETKELVPFCDMYYVDSKEYDPNKGIPVPGTEFLSKLVNPYDVYNVHSNMQARKLFEKHNYEDAAVLWKDVEENLKDKAKQYTLETEQEEVQRDLVMANCYKLWDDFAYSEALKYTSYSTGCKNKSWGYQEKHTIKDKIDVLEILSNITNKKKLFSEDKYTIHYVVDRYQNAVRRHGSGRLYDAIVRFSQVIEMFCHYKIRQIATAGYLLNEKNNSVESVSDTLRVTPLIKFLFGEKKKYERSSYKYYKINNGYILPNINDYSKSIDDIVNLIQARNEFIHFSKIHENKKAQNIAKELQDCALEFIEKLSNGYIITQEIKLETLLNLHIFRQNGLSTSKASVVESVSDSVSTSEVSVKKPSPPPKSKTGQKPHTSSQKSSSTSKPSAKGTSPPPKSKTGQTPQTHSQDNLSTAKDCVNKLKTLTNSEQDIQMSFAIYNERLQTFDSAKQKKKVAEALKAYWEKVGKWQGKLSFKQKLKVKKLKTILDLKE